MLEGILFMGGLGAAGRVVLEVAAERVRSFVEVDQVLTEAAARDESDRCLYCCLTFYNPDGTAGGHTQPVEAGKDA